MKWLRLLLLLSMPITCFSQEAFLQSGKLDHLVRSTPVESRAAACAPATALRAFGKTAQMVDRTISHPRMEM